MRNGQFKDAKETDAHVKSADGTRSSPVHEICMGMENFYRLKRNSRELTKHPYIRLGNLTPVNNSSKIVTLKRSVGSEEARK